MEKKNKKKVVKTKLLLLQRTWTRKRRIRRLIPANLDRADRDSGICIRIVPSSLGFGIDKRGRKLRYDRPWFLPQAMTGSEDSAADGGCANLGSVSIMIGGGQGVVRSFDKAAKGRRKMNSRIKEAAKGELTCSIVVDRSTWDSGETAGALHRVFEVPVTTRFRQTGPYQRACSMHRDIGHDTVEAGSCTAVAPAHGGSAGLFYHTLISIPTCYGMPEGLWDAQNVDSMVPSGEIDDAILCLRARWLLLELPTEARSSIDHS
ncbi:hypothetical protein V8F33_010716 [Rhypophila sp. PSN 637]